MNAIITNSLTNAIYAVSLLFYLISGFFFWIKGDTRFNELIICFFLSLFILALLGTWVHSAGAIGNSQQIWLAISLGIVFSNYCIITALKIPDRFRILIMVLSLISVWFFAKEKNFLFIAAPLIIVYLFAAFYSQKMIRLGFIVCVCANIIWILLRQTTNVILGYEVPAEYRYDNDIYHILLIISTFILYRSVLQGNWSRQPFTF